MIFDISHVAQKLYIRFLSFFVDFVDYKRHEVWEDWRISGTALLFQLKSNESQRFLNAFDTCHVVEKL